MTKEELQEKLKQEAEEWLNKWELCNKCDHKVQCIEDNAMCPQVVERAYLASAEPREKQIQIDAEQIRALQKQNGELTDKVKSLEAQIEKMKRCSICKYSTDLGYCKIRCNGGECNNYDKWEIKEND